MDDRMLIGADSLPGDGVRKAALLLYTLSGPDRDWMLARLPADRRRQLLQLVDELGELGIPPSYSLLDAVKGDVTADRSSAPGQVDDSHADWCAEIDRASPAEVWPILRTEPEQLIAHVLVLHDWSWAPAMAQWLDPMRRTTVRVLLERCRASKYADAKAVNPFLLSRLGERIRALPAEVCRSEQVHAPARPMPRRVRWRWPIFDSDRRPGR